MASLATALFWGLVVYGAIGLLFGLYFVCLAVDRIDPSATGGSLGFRLLILPGTIAMWPLFVLRSGQSQPPTERNAHRRGA